MILPDRTLFDANIYLSWPHTQAGRPSLTILGGYKGVWLALT
jgi:hypothetical protein